MPAAAVPGPTPLAAWPTRLPCRPCPPTMGQSVIQRQWKRIWAPGTLLLAAWPTRLPCRPCPPTMGQWGNQSFGGNKREFGPWAPCFLQPGPPSCGAAPVLLQPDSGSMISLQGCSACSVFLQACSDKHVYRQWETLCCSAHVFQLQICQWAFCKCAWTASKHT